MQYFCCENPVEYIFSVWTPSGINRPVSTGTTLTCSLHLQNLLKKWEYAKDRYQIIYIPIILNAQTVERATKQVIAQFLRSPYSYLYLPKYEILAEVRRTKRK